MLSHLIEWLTTRLPVRKTLTLNLAHPDPAALAAVKSQWEELHAQQACQTLYTAIREQQSARGEQ